MTRRAQQITLDEIRARLAEAKAAWEKQKEITQ